VSGIYLVEDRIRCGWGDFSLVDATVKGLKLIRRLGIGCDRVMLVSGSCMPVRPIRALSKFLDANPKVEFIEAHGPEWVSNGLRHERYQYWHFFNQQSQQRFFRTHYVLQRKFWPKRRFPRGLEPKFGSQWWCLTWDVCEKILDYVRAHPLTYFFFSTTWIPDELFFQTLVHHFTRPEDLAQRNLTFFYFNDWGKPLVFLDEHLEILRQLPYYFARKISGRAKQLRGDLAGIATDQDISDDDIIDWRQPYRFPYRQLLADLPQADEGRSVLLQYRFRPTMQIEPSLLTDPLIEDDDT
jgi:hypothetical protein